MNTEEQVAVVIHRYYSPSPPCECSLDDLSPALRDAALAAARVVLALLLPQRNAEPARTNPTKEQVSDVIRDAIAAIEGCRDPYHAVIADKAAQDVLALLPPQRVPGPLRWKFDGGRTAVLNEDNVIVGYLPAPPQRCAPSEEEMRDAALNAAYEGLRWMDLTDETQADILSSVRAIAALFAAQPTVEEAKADGWDKGADAQYQILGDRLTDDSSNNPYRSEADHG